MTALKPTEGEYRAVPSSRYPLNQKCAHPECDRETDDPHHIFPRSWVTGDDWFVCPLDEDGNQLGRTIPHVIGLCRQHHDDVEQHRAWIKLDEGEFVWYNRCTAEETEAERKRWADTTGEHEMSYPTDDDVWEYIGPLDPQPARGEKSRRRRRKLQGTERRKKVNLTIKVPKDETEDGAGLFYDAVEQLEEILGHDPHRSMYYTIMDALNYTILNEGE